MKNYNRLFHAGIFCALLVGMVSLARGQKALYVTDGSSESDKQSMSLVADAHDSNPLIERDGKLTEVPSHTYALVKVKEYEPIFVAVSDVVVSSSGMQPMSDGEVIDQVFHFRAELESSFRLDHVFVVLEMTPNDPGIKKGIFLCQVGSLTPHQPSPVVVEFPWSGAVGPGHYVFHLFVEGREVLQSLIPWETREHILDDMVARRIAGAPDGPPHLFVNPPPMYPETLLTTKEPGDVVVLMRISNHGSVLDPKIQSASDPAFGTSAIEAVRMWRFLPQIKNGKPVETFASIPIHFSPI
jgi:TonB family protein